MISILTGDAPLNFWEIDYVSESTFYRNIWSVSQKDVAAGYVDLRLNKVSSCSLAVGEKVYGLCYFLKGGRSSKSQELICDWGRMLMASTLLANMLLTCSVHRSMLCLSAIRVVVPYGMSLVWLWRRNTIPLSRAFQQAPDLICLLAEPNVLHLTKLLLYCTHNHIFKRKIAYVL